MGLEPTTFCMARGPWQPRRTPFLHANRSISPVGGRLAIPLNPCDFNGFLPPNSHPGAVVWTWRALVAHTRRSRLT
jgi:hypothetical protein